MGLFIRAFLILSTKVEFATFLKAQLRCECLKEDSLKTQSFPISKSTSQTQKR